MKKLSPLVTIVLLLAIIAIVLVVVLIGVLLRRTFYPMQELGRPSAIPSHGSFAEAPAPHYQSAQCPDVEVIAIPGTWESSLREDPLHPHLFPRSLLLKVTKQLQAKYDHSRAEIYTIAYPAQFRNPQSKPGELSYDDSRTMGTKITRDRIQSVHHKCPLTEFMLFGFSQGAVIAGDIAYDIGQGKGPVSDKDIAFVGLISDGRRSRNDVQNIGPNPDGEGAEVTLNGLHVPGMGITLRGTRVNGFGPLHDRVYSICAPGDLICDAPSDAFKISNAFDSIRKLIPGVQPIHAEYNTTNFWQLQGRTAVQWMEHALEQKIDQAPTIKHG